MSSFDPKVPLNLCFLQEWFGSILTQPIEEKSQLPIISCNGKNIKKEANRYLSSSKKLTAEKRLEIYYKQYWWRLLTTLQDTFPTLCRLFSYGECNSTLFIPYLGDFPSSHWNLNFLGKHFYLWLKKHYKAKDKQVVLAATKIDWAFWYTFFIEKKPPLLFQENMIPKLINTPLTFQFDFQLFHYSFDFFSFRKSFLKNSEEYWIDHPFPTLLQEKKMYFFSFFRTFEGEICWEEIEEAEWQFLKNMQKGNSIVSICNKLEKQKGIFYEQTRGNLTNWIQKWIKNKVFIQVN